MSGVISLVNKFISDHIFCGQKGVENLCRLVRLLGYQDPFTMGQFSSDGSYGDLILFLEAHPKAVKLLIDYIKSNII